MLCTQGYRSGDLLFHRPCMSEMRRDGPDETVKKPVKKYARILPRPTEVFGQPLSIVSQRTGVAARSQGEWCHPIQPSMAIYNQPSTNVFLRLQDESIPSTSEGEETYELPLIQAIGAPDDTPLYSIDSRYLHFFVHELPSLLSIDHLFPNAMNQILGMTIGNPALWHSILAVSSYIADKIVDRPPSQTYIHLHHSLPLIQSAIQNMTIDDSHIAAVFLLAYLCLAGGEIASAGRHLDGLILMLEHRGATTAQDDPLINALRRLAIRLDNVRGTTGRTLGIATHKLVTAAPHREWLTKLIPSSNPQAIDWALAEFELEDLANQMIHLNFRARTLRESPTHNPTTDEHELLFRTEVILNELQRWRLRPIFLAAEADENLSRLACLNQEPLPTFLSYPPLPFKNSVYASHMIMFYRLQILASLIIQPEPGPRPANRLEAAINLCRTFAAYKVLRGRVSSIMVIPLTLAGFVFGETEHPQGIQSLMSVVIVEFEWIAEQLNDIDRMSGLAAATVALNAVRTIWRNPQIHFWDIFFQKSDA